MNVIWTKDIDPKLMEDLKSKYDSVDYVQTIHREKVVAVDVKADVYLVTSPSAVDYAKKNFGDEYFQGKRLICFGKKTAEVLLDSGAKVERVFADNGREFFKILTSSDRFKTKRLAYVGARKTAFPLAKELKKSGYDVVRIEVYSTQSVTLGKSAKTLFERPNNVICVASPSSVRSILSSGFNLPTSTRFICIGQTTAGALSDYDFEIIISPQVTIDSMVESLLALG